MHKVFVVALQELTGEKTFLTFGQTTPISDVMDVIDEEVKASSGTKILGMGFLAHANKIKLNKLISDWKNHFA